MQAVTNECHARAEAKPVYLLGAMFDEGGKIVILVRGKKSAYRAGRITVACLITKRKVSARVQKSTNVHEYQRTNAQKISSFWILSPQLQAPRHYFGLQYHCLRNAGVCLRVKRCYKPQTSQWILYFACKMTISLSTQRISIDRL